MTRKEREKRTVRMMVGIYCRGNCRRAGGIVTYKGGLCESCGELLEYACRKIDACGMGERKKSCRKCPVHCYRPEMREKIRAVMRYAGPRMMFYHPVAAIRHLIDEL